MQIAIPIVPKIMSLRVKGFTAYFSVGIIMLYGNSYSLEYKEFLTVNSVFRYIRPVCTKVLRT